MAKVLIIVGLPGSGKSYWMREREHEFQGLNAQDYFEDSLISGLRFPDSRHYRDLIEDLRAGKDCLIADIAFCDTLRRIEAEQVLAVDVPNAIVQWVFFENNPDACHVNITRDDGPNAFNRHRDADTFAVKYIVPLGIEAQAIWLPDKS